MLKIPTLFDRRMKMKVLGIALLGHYHGIHRSARAEDFGLNP
jgi:hypothetical protein